MDSHGRRQALCRWSLVVAGRGWLGKDRRENQARQRDDEQCHDDLPAQAMPSTMVVGVIRFMGELVVQRIHQRHQFGIVPGQATLDLREDAPVVHRGVHTDHLSPPAVRSPSST